MLLCIARLPGRPDDAALVAKAMGVAVADVAHRLAGVMPRAILSTADPAPILDHVKALLGVGVLAFAIDPAAVPLDDARLVARAVAFGAGGLTVEGKTGEQRVVPWSAITLVQRGQRSEESRETVVTKERKLSLGRAMLTGGLSNTKVVQKEETRTQVSRESFLHLSCDDGPAVMLYERRLDYRTLARVEPSSLANFNAIQQTLRAHATSARFDDRLGKPGFFAGPLLGIPNGVDVALQMVEVAVAAGA